MLLENKLTAKEIERIIGLYPSSRVLKQLCYISNDDILKVCSAYDSMTIGGTKLKDWKLTRDRFEIRIEMIKDAYSYNIDLITGNVTNACQNRILATGSNANVVQFLFHNNYALPVYLGIGHWANRKLPFELNLATPDPGLLSKILDEIFAKDKQKIFDWKADKELHGVNLNDINVYNDTLERLCKEHNLDLNKFL